MAYIGKQGISSTTLTSKTLSTMVGNGSTDTLTLSPAPDSVNDVAIYLDGVFQTPGTEYTLAGSTITFTTAPANNVFVCALVGGGEHIGTPMDNSIGTDKLVDGTLTNVKIDDVSTSKISGTLPALNANAVTGLNAANLVGSAMPAIDGSNLTGISSFTKNANDPAANTNPAGGVGTVWANTTSGEMYVCTDATAGANVWFNVGGGTGNVPVPVSLASGGTLTTDGLYNVHTFNTSSQLTFSLADAPVEYLVIAGGGAGGGRDGTGNGAGGGAGGYRTATGFAVTAQAYGVTVGGGGAGVGTGRGTKGEDSVFSSITSEGGGGGGHYNAVAGGDGGSGGGGGQNSGSGGTATNSGAYGNNGGAGAVNTTSGGGGGAGAVGGAGVISPSQLGGAGGAGLASSITGSAVTRAGGGGGTYSGAGGSGIGGAGPSSAGGGGVGTVNTGSGGGGALESGTSGAGGSGVVIVRYRAR
jgi:hypothetical protein